MVTAAAPQPRQVSVKLGGPRRTTEDQSMGIQSMSLATFRRLRLQHGLPRAIQERARDARNAITVLQETLDRK